MKQKRNLNHLNFQNIYFKLTSKYKVCLQAKCLEQTMFKAQAKKCTSQKELKILLQR